MKRVCAPVAAHRRKVVVKGVTDTVSWLSQSTDIFTKFNEVNLQLQGHDVNLKPNQQSPPSCPSLLLLKRNRARHELLSFQIMNSNSFQLLNELIYLIKFYSEMHLCANSCIIIFKRTKFTI